MGSIVVGTVNESFEIQGGGLMIVTTLAKTPVRFGDALELPLTDGTRRAARVRGIEIFRTEGCFSEPGPPHSVFLVSGVKRSQGVMGSVVRKVENP